MKIDLKKERFEAIEHAFARLLEKSSDKGPLQAIETNLRATFHKSISVEVIAHKDEDDLFLMSVYPDEDTVNEVVRAIVDEKKDEVIRKIWNGADKWYVEIDKRILSGASNLEFNSKELTAMLLHEVGHIVYSNSIPQRISRVMRLEYAKANVGTKQVLKDKVFSQILSIPILAACLYDNYRTKDNIKKELKADVFAVKMGYGDELESALNKLISTSTARPANHVDIDSDKVYSDMKSVTQYSIQTIENLKERKKSLAQANFRKLLMDSPSKYLSKAIGAVQNALVKSSVKGITDDVKMERVADRMDEIVSNYFESEYMTEAFFGKKKLPKIDPKIPDMIKIQIDGIKSNDERALLVSYIHDKLSMVDYYLDVIASENPKYEVYNTKEELTKMKSKLEGYLKDVMDKKIPEFSYRFYVQYPEGFEG